MKDYLKEELSVNEQAEIISIIWRVARKYKLKLYNEQKRSIRLVEELDLAIEDLYEFNNFNYLEYKTILTPLVEDEKTAIVNQLNMLMDELSLFNLKRALTFNEKLVFFLFFVQKYRTTEVMELLAVDRKTIYNRRKSIEMKIQSRKDGLNGKTF